MKRLFFIAHRLPYPPNKGDKLRAYHILKHLRRYFAETYLFTHLDEARDLGVVDQLDLPLAGLFYEYAPASKRKLRCLKGLFKGSLSVAYFYASSLQRKFNRLLKERPPDVIFCSCAPAAEYVFRAPEIRARLFLDFMDVDSEKWAAYAQKTGFPYHLVYALEARRLRAYEARIVQRFERVFLVSANEAELFRRKVLNSSKITVVENGVDLSFFNPHHQSSLSKEGPAVVFTGAMDYPPNAEAVTWFAQNCWPAVKKRCPGARFYVVGKDPLPEVKALHRKDDIIVTGFVPDARDYLALADVCIAPLQLARGVQNKILEAAAMGRAIVATPQAAEGINLKEREEIFIARTPEEFANYTALLLRDQNLARSLGERARKRVEKEYSWEKKLETLTHLFS